MASRPTAGSVLPNRNDPSGVNWLARPATSIASMVSNRRCVSASAAAVLLDARARSSSWVASRRSAEDMSPLLAADGRVAVGPVSTTSATVNQAHAYHTAKCGSQDDRDLAAGGEGQEPGPPPVSS